MNLEFDIRRTIILSGYMRHWGMPNKRSVMTRGSRYVELYSFPPTADGSVHRFATIGLSACEFDNNSHCDAELFLTVPEHVVQHQLDSIINYIFDIAAYVTEELGRSPRSEDLVPEGSLAPKSWPKALLFDEPRGESESLEVFHVGAQHVKLLWLVPIFGSEYSLILEKGIGAFDEAMEGLACSLVEVCRESCA